jgi:Flp pilus assembly pilin Flp
MSIHGSVAARLLDDDGQDIQEYALLLAFVALVSAALFLYNGASVSRIWTSAGSYLAVPNGS